MAYEKTVWKNREVERPRTFEVMENPDGTITLIPSEGEIIEPGTPIIADNMNKIEVGIEEAHNELENKETPTGAQAKADAAEAAAKAYVDQEVGDLAGDGRTTETVKGNADALEAHKADTAKHQTSEQIRADYTNTLRVEVVNSFPSHQDGKVIYHFVEKKFFGSANGEWL